MVRKSLIAMSVAVVVSSAMAIGTLQPATVKTLDQVTVPESAITAPSSEQVTRQALQGKTEAVRLAAVQRIVDQDVLLKVIRGDSSEKVRRAAFQRIVDADLMFRLVFKPGLKGGVRDVRLDALRALPEIEWVKLFARASCKDPALRKIAEQRLRETFRDAKDRDSQRVHPSVGASILRTRQR